MEQGTNTKTEPSGSPRPELVRPVEGRFLAGVSKGLAERLGIPLWLVRAFFVVTAFAGGFGVALYAAGWALMRSEDEPESPAERFFEDASSSRSWIGIGLIFVAALILLDRVTFLDGGVVWAVGLLVIGVLIYTGHIPTGGQGSGDTPEETDAGDEPPETRAAASETVESATGDADPPRSAPPPEPDPPVPPKPRERSVLGRLTIGMMFLGVGVLALLHNIEGLGVDAAPRHYLALAVIILGVGLMVGGFAGRARWLILVGAVLVPTLLLSPVLEYEWRSERFDQRVAPSSFADLEESYGVDVGYLEIDLTELPWDGRTVHLHAHVDMGNLEIWIPEDVGVQGRASADLGRVAGLGRESIGLGDPSVGFGVPGPRGTVVLDASVDIGNIDIIRP